MTSQHSMAIYIHHRLFQSFIHQLHSIRFDSSTQTMITFFCYCILLSQAAQLVFGKFAYNIEPDTVYYSEDNRIRGFSQRKNVDIILGAVFPVHNSIGGVCQQEIFTETTDYMEAVLYAIDLINDDDVLLPNITLGYDLRDSCITENIALEEAADMILQTDPDICTLDPNTTILSSVSAIIGDYASFISVPMAGFLRLFSTPQISIATSVLLSDRERYNYFYRTVPSDDQQTQAIIDLSLHFNWTYVSTLHSNDLYGEPGIDNFRKLAAETGICIDLDEGIDDDFTELQYISLANKVLNSTANVIVFFSSLNPVDGLLQYLQEAQSDLNQPRTFTWIAGDTWADSTVVFSKYEKLVRGMWGVVPLTTNHPGFYKYFSELTPSNNIRNKWYVEYHEAYYNCTKNVTCNDNSIGVNQRYRNNSFTPFVIDAVYGFAHAFNDFINDNCDKPIIWNTTAQKCKGQRNKLNGAALRDYLKLVDFVSVTGNTIQFDRTGSIEGKYFILNYQQIANSEEYEIIKAAIWNGKNSTGNRLEFTQNINYQFGVNERGEPSRSLVSQCQNCPLGHVHRSVLGSCCGRCSPCLGQNYSDSLSDQDCMSCPLYTWGNNPLNGSYGCNDIQQLYLDPSDSWGISLIILCSIGIISVVLVTIAMIIFWNKPVIKSSGREQMMLLLAGATWCFLSTIFFILRPSITVCLLQRMSTWLCFSVILSALFVKLVRIARIFLRKQSSKRPRFIEPVYQVIFTMAIVSVQLVLVIISLLIVYPESTKSVELNAKDTNNYPKLIIKCASPHVAMIVVQMLLYSILLITSNALAMLTIRFPANFNEVRYVAFTTFSIGLIWITFIIAYFATENEFQTAVISFAIQMSAFAVLVCIFASRIFIIIFLPGNDQTTHIGTDILSTLNKSKKYNNNNSVQSFKYVVKTKTNNSPDHDAAEERHHTEPSPQLVQQVCLVHSTVSNSNSSNETQLDTAIQDKFVTVSFSL